MQKNNFFNKLVLCSLLLALGLSISCKQKATKPDIKIVDFTQTLDSLSSKRVLPQDIYMLKNNTDVFLTSGFQRLWTITAMPISQTVWWQPISIILCNKISLCTRQ